MAKTTNGTNKASPAAKKATSSKAKKSSSRGGSGGSSGKQMILDLLLTFETRQNGDPNVARKTILSLSGVKANTFVVTLSQMKSKGLIEYEKDFIRLTENGRSQANACGLEDSNVAMDNERAQADIKERLKLGSGNAGKLFDLLVDGRAHDRATVMEQIGCENKATFAVMLSNLKKKEILSPDKTTIQLTDICFPFGRPSVE